MASALPSFCKSYFEKNGNNFRGFKDRDITHGYSSTIF
jgi:hypothetical protein